MTLTPLEMITTYNQSSDKKKQIQIFTEIEGMTKEQVVKILEEGGCKVDGRIFNKGNQRQTEEPRQKIEEPKGNCGIFIDAKEVSLLQNILKDVSITASDIPAIFKIGRAHV